MADRSPGGEQPDGRPTIPSRRQTVSAATQHFCCITTRGDVGETSRNPCGEKMLQLSPAAGHNAAIGA